MLAGGAYAYSLQQIGGGDLKLLGGRLSMDGPMVRSAVRVPSADLHQRILCRGQVWICSGAANCRGSADFSGSDPSRCAHRRACVGFHSADQLRVHGAIGKTIYGAGAASSAARNCLKVRDRFQPGSSLGLVSPRPPYALPHSVGGIQGDSALSSASHCFETHVPTRPIVAMTAIKSIPKQHCIFDESSAVFVLHELAKDLYDFGHARPDGF